MSSNVLNVKVLMSTKLARTVLVSSSPALTVVQILHVYGTEPCIKCSNVHIVHAFLKRKKTYINTYNIMVTILKHIDASGKETIETSKER